MNLKYVIQLVPGAWVAQFLSLSGDATCELEKARMFSTYAKVEEYACKGAGHALCSHLGYGIRAVKEVPLFTSRTFELVG